MILLPRAVALAVTFAALGALAFDVVQRAEEHPTHEREERRADSSDSSSSDSESNAAEEISFGFGKENGPKTWPKKFLKCGGKRQSPINIKMDKVEEIIGEGAELTFKNFDAQPKSMAIANLGHTLSLTGNWTTKETPRITGSRLKGDYMFFEVHFHWGKNSEEGGEHFVDGCGYPAEMHAVYWKKEYGCIQEAVKHRDGLALVAYFLEIKDENPVLKKLLDKIDDVIEADSPPEEISPFMLEKLTPPFHRKYVIYEGSMSIPPCLQVVTWFVRLKPLQISMEQLKQFRRLKDDDGNHITRNFRPTQPLHGRIVSYKD